MTVFRNFRGVSAAVAATMVVATSALLNGAAVAPASAQTDDASAYRELAQRVIGDQSGGLQVTLLPGKLADVTPAVISPPRWRVVGSIVRTPPARAGIRNGGTSLYWDAPDGPADSIRALTSALSGAGWTASSQGPQPPSGGFVPAGTSQPSNAVFCGTKSGFAYASATAVPGEATHVALNVLSVPENVASGSCVIGSSGPPLTVIPSIPAPYAQLPSLQLPAGVETFTGPGTGGGPFSASSSVTIAKAPPIAQLDQLFSAQLEAAGWKRFAGTADPAVVVRVWRKSTNGVDLQAALTVSAAIGGDDRVDLSVVVSIPASSQGPYAYSGGPVGPPIIVGPPGPIVTAPASPAATAGGFATGSKKAKTLKTTRPTKRVTSKFRK